jgi:hypothetical protein
MDHRPKCTLKKNAGADVPLPPPSICIYLTGFGSKAEEVSAKAALQSLAENGLGFAIDKVGNKDNTWTHVVLAQDDAGPAGAASSRSAIRRTLKTIAALVSGKWLVSEDWLGVFSEAAAASSSEITASGGLEGPVGILGITDALAGLSVFITDAAKAARLNSGTSMSALRKLITMGGASLVPSMQNANFIITGNQEEKSQSVKAWEEAKKPQQQLVACLMWDELVEKLHPSGLKWGDVYCRPFQLQQ